MRKVICMLAALLLCVGMVFPADASGVFVPSVTYKPTPPVQDAILQIPEELIEKLPEEYREVIEELLQEQQQQTEPTLEQEPDQDPQKETEEAPDQTIKEDGVIRQALKTCVVVTSIQQAREKTTDIFQESRDILLDLYEHISETALVVTDQETPTTDAADATQSTEAKDAMKLFFHDEEFVIREMVDVSLRKEGCVEDPHLHREVLEIEDITISVDFDLGVGPEVEVIVLSYRDEKWSQVEEVINNGDGSITCIFEHFCPVIFCVPASTLEVPETQPATVPVFSPVQPAEPVPDYPLMPLILLLTAFVLFLLLIFLRRRRKEEENT